MEKLYKVAGFVFRLGLPDESPVWKLLGNYSPFEQENQSGYEPECIFSISLCDSLYDSAAEPYYMDSPENADMPKIDIFRQSGGYLFRMYVSSRDKSPYSLWLSSDFSNGLLQKYDVGKAGRFPVDNALMLAFALRTAGLDTLEMHASVTVKDGKGYLFLGQSGTGKSTHSRMWLENIPGTRLLNDDNPVVRVLDDGQVRVYGTPWSGKTPCYVNSDCPVGAFVAIQQYPENIAVRMNLIESYASLYSSSSGMKMDRAMTDKLHQTLEKVLGTVPCWRMKCLPDADAAVVCCNNVCHGYSDSAE